MEIILKTKTPFYILNPYSKFKIYWTVLIIVLLIYAGLVLPPRLAFKDESGVDWVTVDLFVDSIFLFDILVNFFSAFETDQNVLEIDLKNIWMNYLTGWFSIDFISSLPMYVMFEDTSFSKYNSYLRLTRIPRIYKLSKVFKRFSVLQKLVIVYTKKIGAEYVQIIKFSIITLYLIHFFGCAWYYLT